ncbi:MAG: YraN family protein [Acidobacteriaceae bacterium]
MSLSAQVTRILLKTLDRAAHLLGRQDERSSHLITGERGEEAAYFYLRQQGYTVVARNYRAAASHTRGELDIVAWEGETLCFVEVKTRTARDFAAAESAVDPEKRHDLRRIAQEYIRHLPGVSGSLRSARQTPLPSTRFDVVSVYLLRGKKPEITLLRDNFGW